MLSVRVFESACSKLSCDPIPGVLLLVRPNAPPMVAPAKPNKPHISVGLLIVTYMHGKGGEFGSNANGGDGTEIPGRVGVTGEIGVPGSIDGLVGGLMMVGGVPYVGVEGVPGSTDGPVGGLVMEGGLPYVGVEGVLGVTMGGVLPVVGGVGVGS